MPKVKERTEFTRLVSEIDSRFATVPRELADPDDMRSAPKTPAALLTRIAEEKFDQAHQQGPLQSLTDVENVVGDVKRELNRPKWAPLKNYLSYEDHNDIEEKVDRSIRTQLNRMRHNKNYQDKVASQDNKAATSANAGAASAAVGLQNDTVSMTAGHDNLSARPWSAIHHQAHYNPLTGDRLPVDDGDDEGSGDEEPLARLGPHSARTAYLGQNADASRRVLASNSRQAHVGRSQPQQRKDLGNLTSTSRKRQHPIDEAEDDDDDVDVDDTFMNKAPRQSSEDGAARKLRRLAAAAEESDEEFLVPKAQRQSVGVADKKMGALAGADAKSSLEHSKSEPFLKVAVYQRSRLENGDYENVLIEHGYIVQEAPMLFHEFLEPLLEKISSKVPNIQYSDSKLFVYNKDKTIQPLNSDLDLINAKKASKNSSISVGYWKNHALVDRSNGKTREVPLRPKS